MKITIAERLHPFSHKPGMSCVLPKSYWKVEVFPSLLRFQSLLNPNKKIEYVLGIVGPILDFTAEVDLEKGQIRVFGKTQTGYLRYIITKKTDGIALFFEKVPEKMSKEAILLATSPESDSVVQLTERLSLGAHTSQDMDLIKRRKDLREIFPLWLRLSQLLPQHSEPIEPIGTFRLLLSCQESINRAEKLTILPAFTQLFQTALTGILSPRLIDEEYQGILAIGEIIPNSMTPLPILIEGGRLIRSLFFQESGRHLQFLPCLPPDFTSGRFTGIQTQNQEQISFEWSKHQIKKVIIQTQEASCVTLQFPKMIRSFRLRTSLRESGVKKKNQDGQFELELHSNKTLLLDRFEK